MAGFTSGEGCFYIKLEKIGSTNSKTYFKANFSLGQHAREEQLLSRSIDLFQASNVSKHGNYYEFIITKVGDLFTKVLPLFNEAPPDFGKPSERL
jgi:hypothetical protein